MDAKIRVTRSANALNLHVSIRLPYCDLEAAAKVLQHFLADRLRRTG